MKHVHTTKDDRPIIVIYGKKQILRTEERRFTNAFSTDGGKRWSLGLPLKPLYLYTLDHALKNIEELRKVAEEQTDGDKPIYKLVEVSITSQFKVGDTIEEAEDSDYSITIDYITEDEDYGFIYWENGEYGGSIREQDAVLTPPKEGVWDLLGKIVNS